jgi:hypothetical protein
VAYAYFETQNQHSIGAVLTAILKQLTPYLRKNGTPHRTDTQRLIQDIVSIASQFQSIFILIDALDEVAKSELPAVLAAMEGLLSGPRVKILATSRPHVRINDDLLDRAKILEVTAPQNDIRTCVSEKVKEGVSSVSGLEEIVSELSEKATEYHLISRLPNLSFLVPQARWNLARRSEDVLSALANSRKELPELYNTIFNTICTHENKDAALAVLSWILHAERPLMMSELSEVIKWGPASPTTLPNILGLCGNLIWHVEENNTIVFSHEEVYDFLKNNYASGLLNETDLAKQCLAYLNNLDNLYENDIHQLRQLPFASYAARYWGKHAKGEGENDPALQRLVLQLASPPGKTDSLYQLALADGLKDFEFPSFLRNTGLIDVLATFDLVDLAKSLQTFAPDNVVLS